jgi:hypothetical protein
MAKSIGILHGLSLPQLFQHMRILFILGFLFCSILGTSQPTFINTLADSGPGSLRLAIFNSAPGDTIAMSPSLIASGSDTLFFTAQIFIPHSLTIIGAMNNTDTLFFSGNNITRLFEVDRTNQTSIDIQFNDLAIVKGYFNNNGNSTNNQGGAVQLIGPGNFYFNNCTFKKNNGVNRAHGGAINCVNCSLIVNDCGFLRNSVEINGIGGAIRVKNGQLKIKNSYFFRNAASSSGSDVNSLTSVVNIKNCSFVGSNQPNLWGVSLSSGKTIIENSYFYSFDRSNISIAGDTSVVLKNNYFTRYGSTTSLINDAINSKKSNLEYNTFFCTGDQMKLSLFYSDTLILLGNSLIFNVINTSLPNYSMTINALSSSLPPSNQLLRIENNTFLLSSAPSTSPGARFSITPASNPIISNNIFFSNSNSNTLLVGENSTFTQMSSPASDGYNIFSDNNPNSVTSDFTQVNSAQLALEPFGYYGGVTPTRIPKANSMALNSGNPNNFSPAQNGPIYGVRDRGAAERPVISNDTVWACFGPVTWWGNVYTSPGVYLDTVANSNTLDSTGILVIEGLVATLANNGGVLEATANDSANIYWLDCTAGAVVDTGATFLPITNGSYAAIAQSGTCFDTTNCISYNEVSLNEQPFTRVVVYPNPTSGTIRFLLRQGELPTSYRITDLQGRLLGQGPLVEPTLHFQGFPLGTYLLHFSWKNGSQEVERIFIAP